MEIILSGARLGGAILVALVLWLPSSVRAVPVFINELHYDNRGADRDEGVEIAAPAGSLLDGWRLVFYDGRRGRAYATVDLSGRVIDAGQGYGFHHVSRSGIQNGAPDGVALVDAVGKVVQFLSYEGDFEATSGVAAGLRSVDIGVAEAGDTPPGSTLQLTGSGSGADDFHWTIGSSSFGRVNQGQRFDATPASIPEPSTLLLLLTAAAACIHRRRRREEGLSTDQGVARCLSVRGRPVPHQ